jgi:hypothetical protein|nr:MAG TPA: hypothetical protein [Caudoviricetes sp.]
MNTLTDFDKLRKYISDPAGKKLMTEIRKRIKSDQEFSNKLYYFFVNSMDGGEPEILAKEYKLL